MKNPKQQFDRAAALERLAEVFKVTDSEAEITRAVSEYLGALRAWRRQTAPAVPKGQPTAAGQS